MCRIETNKTSPKYTLSKNTPLCRSEEIWTPNRFMSHEHFSVQVSFWFHNWLCLASPCFCAQVARVVKKQVNQQTQEHWSTCRLSQHIIAISWYACKTVSMLSLTASMVASCCITYTYHSFTVINLNYICTYHWWCKVDRAWRSKELTNIYKHSNKIARTSVLQEMRPNLFVASVSCGSRKLFLVQPGWRKWTHGALDQKHSNLFSRFRLWWTQEQPKP